MRSFGLVLTIVGIAFGILFFLALLGGGKDLLPGFVVAAVLIVIGWQFRRYGKGVTQQESASAMSEAIPEPSSPQQSPTTELPVTPAISAAVILQVARWRRTTGIIIACGLAFFLLFAVVLYLAEVSPTGLKPVVIPVAVGALVLVLLVGGIHLFQRERPVRRDLHAHTYLRTSGPVEVISMSGGWLLRMADRSFLVDRRTAKVLQNLTWATVDYSRDAHVIFEIRDQDGDVVYSAVRATE